MLRNISHELMPPEFEHLSLDEILYQYADKLSETQAYKSHIHPVRATRYRMKQHTNYTV